MTYNLPKPLIPLPTPLTSLEDDPSLDPYSPLFRSPTRATVLSGENSVPALATQTSDDVAMSPTRSDSEFGAFVSVDSFQDPLSAGSFDSFASPTAASSFQTAANADGFFDTAKARTQASRSKILEEIRNHEADLANASASGSDMPFDLIALSDAMQTPLSESLPDPPQQLVDVEPDIPLSNQSHSPALSKSSLESSRNRHHHHPNSPSHKSHSLPLPTTRLIRKSSLPSLSSSPPEEPLHDPMSMSLTHDPSLPTATQLLGTVSMRASHFLNATTSRSKSFFGGGGSPSAFTPSIPPNKRHTPFASELFTPPTGAPGFGGDHNWNNKGFDFQTSENLSKKSVILTGRKETTEGILTAALADAIRPSLPALARLSSKWSLLYSLDQHGISLKTFYHHCGSHEGGSLLIVQDAEGGVFGAWISEPLMEHDGSYYGSGDSFLWKQTSDNIVDHAVSIEVYKWTGKNDYVALCEADAISFGGGDGHYGLYLSSALIEGSSARCPTFGNEVLCTQMHGSEKGLTTEFECVGLEVWGVKLGG